MVAALLVLTVCLLVVLAVAYRERPGGRRRRTAAYPVSHTGSATGLGAGYAGWGGAGGSCGDGGGGGGC